MPKTRIMRTLEVKLRIEIIATRTLDDSNSLLKNSFLGENPLFSSFFHFQGIDILDLPPHPGCNRH